MFARFFPGGRETGTRTFSASRSHSSKSPAGKSAWAPSFGGREHPDDLVRIGQAALAQAHDLLLVLGEGAERLAARRRDGDGDAGPPRLRDGEDDLLQAARRRGVGNAGLDRDLLEAEPLRRRRHVPGEGADHRRPVRERGPDVEEDPVPLEAVLDLPVRLEEPDRLERLEERPLHLRAG